MNAKGLIPVIQKTPIYHPLRNLYLRTLKRKYWEDHILAPRRFFRQFVQPGSTVFDIGANVGEYTHTFLALGARKVVAVEPTPILADELKRIRNARLSVVAAAGAVRGKLLLKISNHSQLNSFSPEWIDNALEIASEGHPQWIGEVEVDVFSIDDLIRTWGVPDFIKIDVEGYELEVLKGMSRVPKLVSFEFHVRFCDSAIACIRQNCFPGSARFNYLLGEPRMDSSLGLPEWCNAERMAYELLKLTRVSPTGYGDIFVLCE